MGSQTIVGLSKSDGSFQRFRWVFVGNFGPDVYDIYTVYTAPHLLFSDPKCMTVNDPE